MARKSRQVIEYRLYELPLDFPIMLLDGDIWHISDVPSDRLHFHNCLEIGFCHECSGTLVLNSTPLAFRDGDISIIPRHVPHTTYSSPGERSLWSYIFLDLNALLADMFTLPTDFNKEAEHFQFLMSRQSHPKVHFLLSAILDELRDQKSGYRHAVKGLFITLYYEMIRVKKEREEMVLKPSAPKKETLVLTPALEYINENYMNKLTIDQLSAMCHLSATHFRRLFLSIMGTSPLVYINATRIDRSLVLLKTTEAAILDIAGDVGFSSLSSFNRAFTALLKTSPRAYRNSDSAEIVKTRPKYILKYSGWVEPDK